MSNTLKRCLSHLFVALSIAVAALFLPRIVLLISLGVVTFIGLAFELLRLKAPVINRWFLSFFKPLLKKQEASRITGASYMLIAALIAFLVFQRDIAVLAICFLAVGDPLAIIVGIQIGKRKLFGKTLEGDLACLISCIAIGAAFYYGGIGVPWLTILAGAIGTAIVEALPLPIDDNLTMPLFAGLVMTIMPV